MLFQRILNTAFSLPILAIFLGFVLHVSTWATDPLDDPLFPQHSLKLENIKSGMELAKKSALELAGTDQRIFRCETILEDTQAVRQNHSGLCLGSGSIKVALKLNENSDKIILYGPDKAYAEAENRSYRILNAFGFVSQQNPEIVSVAFNNETVIKDVLCVDSFDFLAREGTNRRTWDLKNGISFGNISIFNGKANYDDVEYHYRLIYPLVQDIALWYALDTPGHDIDSPNLIFKNKMVEGKTQSICRLFLYDIQLNSACLYDEFGTYGNKFRSKKITSLHNFSSGFESHVRGKLECLYRAVWNAMTPGEKIALWGETKTLKKIEKYHSDDLRLMWDKLKNRVMEEFKKETHKIKALFDDLSVSDPNLF